MSGKFEETNVAKDNGHIGDNEKDENEEIRKAIIASIKESEDSIANPSQDMNMNSINTDCTNTEKYGSEPNTETFENIETTPRKIDSKSVDEVLDNFNNNRDEKMKKEKLIKAEKTAKRKRSVKKEIKQEDSFSESFSEDEVNCDLSKDDFDYKPQKRVKVETMKTSYRLIAPKKNEALSFNCGNCKFISQTLGELKIHRHLSHKGCDLPSYLDMAEVSIAKLKDTEVGTDELTVLKEVLFDNFDTINDHKSRASELLSKALKGGVKLGRLKVSRGRGRGKEMFGLVPVEMMNEVVKRWRRSRKSVEFVDDIQDGTKRRMKVTGTYGNLSSKTVADIVSVKPKLKPVQRSKIVQVCQAAPPTVQVGNTKDTTAESYESDQDDPNYLLTCPICKCSYWYENQTLKHIKQFHPDHEGLEKLVSSA